MAGKLVAGRRGKSEKRVRAREGLWTEEMAAAKIEGQKRVLGGLRWELQTGTTTRKMGI